jgi:hypothetical protein
VHLHRVSISPNACEVFGITNADVEALDRAQHVDRDRPELIRHCASSLHPLFQNAPGQRQGELLRQFLHVVRAVFRCVILVLSEYR